MEYLIFLFAKSDSSRLVRTKSSGRHTTASEYTGWSGTKREAGFMTELPQTTKDPRQGFMLKSWRSFLTAGKWTADIIVRNKG